MINLKEPASFEIEVYVKPKHVRNMLIKFLIGKISADELTKWAYFICARPEYGNEFYMNDEKVIYYEDMFNIIRYLSTPKLDGEVNFESVKVYLDDLKKYANEF